MAVASVYPQNSSANEFTAKQVLDWKETSQNNLFQDSIAMTSIIATQTGRHDHIATCIDGWYFVSDDVRASRNSEIRDALRRFPDSHPQAIILAVIQKACGKFGDS
ncbi:MAG: hypothetical protein AAF367_19465 [Pseudomonadota bacterium]